MIVVDGDRNYMESVSIIREPHCNKISQEADTYYDDRTRYMMQLFQVVICMNSLSVALNQWPKQPK